MHTVTRLKSVPALRDSQELPEAERTRGAALADQLSVPVAGRAWQMLLKGVGEVETAPDRRAAAEMVLIRLCHVSDLPSPGDLVRRLAAGGTDAGERSAAPARPAAAAALARAVGGSAMPPAAPDATPRLASFRDVVALVAERREAMLHAHLMPLGASGAFRAAGDRIAAATGSAARPRATARRAAGGGDRPPLDHRPVRRARESRPSPKQGSAADAARRTAAADHPLVQRDHGGVPRRANRHVHMPPPMRTDCRIAGGLGA